MENVPSLALSVYRPSNQLRRVVRVSGDRGYAGDQPVNLFAKNGLQIHRESCPHPTADPKVRSQKERGSVNRLL